MHHLRAVLARPWLSQDLRQAPAVNRQDRDRADPSGACSRYVSNHRLVAGDLTPIGSGSDTLSQQ